MVFFLTSDQFPQDSLIPDWLILRTIPSHCILCTYRLISKLCLQNCGPIIISATY